METADMEPAPPSAGRDGGLQGAATANGDGAFRRFLMAERRAAVEETMTALAHDTRNALQLMQSCLTLMKLRGNDEVQTLVDDMQETQDQLLRLFEEIETAVAPLQLDRRQADVRKLVERAWRRLRLKWSEKAIEWVVRLEDPADTKAFVDSQRLGQALRSVLEHAIAASPKEGTVACAFAHRTGGRKTVLEVAIEDAGPQVSVEAQGQARRFLYEARRRGSGLGLAIAQRIVDEHDGCIVLDVRPGGGARVVITLPCSDEAPRGMLPA